MSNNASVFVGNIPFEATEEELAEALGKDKVSEVIIQKNLQNKSKGWAIAVFHKSDDAKETISRLNGTELKGRKLHVAIDRREIEKIQGVIAVVVNLAYSITDDQLFEIFKNLNPLDAHVKTTRSGKSRGFGLVKFRDENGVQEAIAQYHEKEFEGRQIKVKQSTLDPNEERPKIQRPRRDRPNNMNNNNNRGGNTNEPRRNNNRSRNNTDENNNNENNENKK